MDSLRPTLPSVEEMSFRTASRENLSSGFPARSDTNWAVQLLRMARGLKFRIEKVEELY